MDPKIERKKINLQTDRLFFFAILPVDQLIKLVLTNTKIREIEKKIPADIKYITMPEFDKLTAKILQKD